MQGRRRRGTRQEDLAGLEALGRLTGLGEQPKGSPQGTRGVSAPRAPEADTPEGEPAPPSAAGEPGEPEEATAPTTPAAPAEPAEPSGSAGDTGGAEDGNDVKGAEGAEGAKDTRDAKDTKRYEGDGNGDRTDTFSVIDRLTVEATLARETALAKAPGRRRRRGIALTALAVVVVLLVGAGAFKLTATVGSPGATADAYLRAWAANDTAAMRALVDGPPADFDRWYRQVHDDLGVTAARYTPGTVREDGAAAKVPFAADLTLHGFGAWRYDGALRMVKRDRHWLVRWTPAAIHPELRAGLSFAVARAWPERAVVADAKLRTIDTPDAPGSVRQLVGTLGPATAADAKKPGAGVVKGTTIGTSGLQKGFQQRLAGKPGLRVQLRENGKVIQALARTDQQPGQPLVTTLNLDVQKAATDALAPITQPAAMVAIRPSTGEVLAVVNQPGGYNRALLGTYPPGSTFKIITASALVAGGMTPDQPVPCPPSATVLGRTFRNAGGESFGNPPLRDAFAHSCNTTFGTLGVSKLGAARLTRVAGDFGFGAPVVLAPGIAANRAQFPKPHDDADLAAASFGQSRVTASPLNMATVAAAIADGNWRSPRLVAANLTGTKPVVRKLDPKLVAALRQLMPAVVTEGTARGVAFPPGTAGKTGTAEFGAGGAGGNLPTHSWFVGYRGDVAFAVIAEGAGTGAQVAAPAAARFLTALGG